MTLLLQIDERAWVLLGNLFYAAAFGVAFVSILRSRRHSRLVLFLLVATGFLLQSTGLYMRGIETRSCPLGNPFEILQFVAWSLIVIYLVVGPSFRMSLLGFFSSGLAAVLGLTALMVPEWDATRAEGLLAGTIWIELHAALAIFSYGAFGMLALTSLMYLLQNYSLKHKRFEGVFDFLPSLYQLEHMNLRLLALGLSILSLSLLFGLPHWIREFESVDSTKLVVTSTIWLAYLGALILRLRETLIARPLAWTCILLFLLALSSIPPVDASRKPPPPADSALTTPPPGASPVPTLQR